MSPGGVTHIYVYASGKFHWRSDYLRIKDSPAQPVSTSRRKQNQRTTVAVTFARLKRQRKLAAQRRACTMHRRGRGPVAKQRVARP